jgi:hypothetical protein
MSGIAERIEEKLDVILRHIAAGPGAAAPPVVAPPVTPPPPALDPLAGGGAPAYPPATQEMIVALVTPLVNDPNTKAALQAEMHAMGIAALPEAQPHQYPELYYRFQQVQARSAGAAAIPAAAAPPASII